MTVLDFVRFTRANLRLIFVTFSLGLIAAFLYSASQPAVYTASSVGYVVTPGGATVGDASSSLQFALQKAEQYTTLAQNTSVAARVIQTLHLDATPDQIAGAFSASADTVTPSITVSASAGSPVEARDLANAVIGAMAKQATVLDNLANPPGSPIVDVVRLVPQQLAALPGAPSSPNVKKKLLEGALAGIALGYGLGMLRRQLDRKIRSVDEIEGLIGASVLSVIPETDQLDRVRANGLVDSHTGPAAEALRQLRTNLRFVDVDRPPRSILITSANPAEGKSVVASNLARVLAAAGQPTVLLDADLRRPMQGTIFDLDPAVGLTQVLAGDVSIEDACQDSGVPNLMVMAAGRIPPNPSELLGSHRMSQLIDELTGHGNLVLIDAPPLLPVTDAGLLSGTVDGTLLVLAIGRTYKEQAKLAGRVLEQVGGHLLGTVLNRASVRGIGSVIYGYGYSSFSRDYYGPYGGSGPSKGSRRRADPGSAHDDSSSPLPDAGKRRAS